MELYSLSVLRSREGLCPRDASIELQCVHKDQHATTYHMRHNAQRGTVHHLKPGQPAHNVLGTSSCPTGSCAQPVRVLHARGMLKSKKQTLCISGKAMNGPFQLVYGAMSSCEEYPVKSMPLAD